MTFVPVIDRELRVSARKRSTFWLRVVSGIIGLIIGAAFLILSSIFGQGTAGLGSALFTTLTWLAMAAAISGGLFFTADALSEEKREGTLGFLFLTDLRGYDVAGGKLAATSLRGSYALLAFFPVLAATFLMGGITGGAFWKTNLALVNGLFVSLSVGLLVSSLNHDSQKAMTATFLTLLLVCAAGPLIDAGLSHVRRLSSWANFRLSSPVYVFVIARAWGRAPFWTALLISHLLGWMALGTASFLVRRTWQEGGRRTTRSAAAARWMNFGLKRSAHNSQKLLQSSPVLWLASRERWPALLLWLLTLLATISFCFGLSQGNWVLQGWSQLSWLLVVFLYLWASAQASRLFMDTRRGGFLEIFLVTPLGIKDAAAGQWRAWLRGFAPPLLLLLAIDFAGRWLAQDSMVTALGTGTGYNAAELAWFRALSLVAAGLVTLSVGFNLCALLWFGLWMGLTSKNASLAVLKTIAFVQIIPVCVIYFVSMMVVGLVAMNQGLRTAASSGKVPSWFPLLIPMLMSLVPAVLAIAKDIGFILWSRRRLYNCPRERAIWNLRGPVQAPQVPQPASPPPPGPTAVSAAP